LDLKDPQIEIYEGNLLGDFPNILLGK